jgi:MoxR-like ATPase
MTTTPFRFDTSFAPGIAITDRCASAWLRQATLRLRREIAWQWHLRDQESDRHEDFPGRALLESLDLMRTWGEKRSFHNDDAIRYLTELIREAPPAPDPAAPCGSFSWVMTVLDLDDVATFALALGLLARIDASARPVFAACLGGSDGTALPTLSLVQKLIDDPTAALSLADETHDLWRMGLLQPDTGSTAGGMAWDTGFAVPPAIAMRLIDPDQPLPAALERLTPPIPAELPNFLQPLASTLRLPATGLRIVPVQAAPGVDAAAMVATVSTAADRRVCRSINDRFATGNPDRLRALVTLSWLNGVDLFVRLSGSHDPGSRTTVFDGCDLPVTVYLQTDRDVFATLPPERLLPRIDVPRLSHQERVARWERVLGPDSGGIIEDCARRFRFEAQTIDRIGASLDVEEHAISRTDLLNACRAAMPVDTSGLAQLVTPRFEPDEFILPPVQRRQFREIVQAMRALTQVHYGWGTARVWNEGGISVLFAGPSGTGKTMGAEVLAVLLGIPMYRISLAQIVNKYIGETEKNLERVFDACDTAEAILFFDEADALFGRRTDVQDAHDRYANLEVSYLLERMERFKGLAILATNRQDDLDEAFLRRLRYIVEFPVPDVKERRRLWESMLPARVDGSLLDLDFLARQFQLTGGNIRSVIFNACLQTAQGNALDASDQPPQLTMEHVIVAVKREYDKLQRTVSLEQFGSWARIVEAVSHE